MVGVKISPDKIYFEIRGILRVIKSLEVMHMEINTNATHTEKELLYLQDQLGAEALTIKKLMEYKGSLEDPELKNMVDNMITKHQGHYNKLLTHIRG